MASWEFESTKKRGSDSNILFTFIGVEFFDSDIVNKCIKLIFETCLTHKFIRRPFTWLYLRVPWLVRIRLPNRKTGTSLA